ncbi:uncharacterized protein LOC131851527 [Achroia grisella]|uniref:uncharacterized protein LOC131851527 n=1 Tax=Achroia grisella TaxID=688607 RepID=UPI0027D2D53B|nr:uncharacterized protein LOC131851527 [Achroia grisella]
MLLYLVWFVVVVAALALYYRQVYTRFSKYGVKHFSPIPVVGNMGRIILRVEHFTDDVQRNYDQFPEERFVGRYEFVKPVLMVKDLELVKKIAIKDFEYFLDHRTFVDETVDPVFGRNLISLKGQEWKDMRASLSPAFTSSKIRLMVPFMVEVGDQMIQALKTKIRDSGVNYVDIEAKDLTTRYANDVIASCAFGLKVNSHMDEQNEFYQKGKTASTFGFIETLKFFFFISFPKLMAKLKVTLFSKDTTNFFQNLVLGTMRNREDQKIVRPDMIHLLMEAQKGKLTYDDKMVQDTNAGFATVEESSVGKKVIDRVWTDTDLVAQAVLFFIAGFETVSAAMSFALHELALNPEVQEKLAQEIKENDIKNGGKFDYKSIQNMTYMDMVVSEVLRLWPPAVGLDRICTKDYNLGKPNSKATEDYILRKGEGILIPTFSLHRDPELFSNPLKFDPERFSEENKDKIQPLSYMPFGLGPRNCIGSRFALCEVKVMLYQLLQHMEISPCEKTCVSSQLATDTFNLRIKGGHWMRLKIRSYNNNSHYVMDSCVLRRAMLLYLVWFVVVVATLALYYKQVYSRFSKYGVKHFSPIPVAGNMGRILLRIEHLTDAIQRNYDHFSEERFVGRYDFVKPVLMVKDLELVKKIAIKDFEYFLDHTTLVDATFSSLLIFVTIRSLDELFFKGQEWKDMRASLSPAFTSSKIRIMVPFMVEVGDQMMQALKTKIRGSGVNYVDIEAKDLTTRYANDVIASCAFGLKVDSHMDERNEFYQKGKSAATFGFIAILKFFLLISFPKLMAKIKLSPISKATTNFFKNLVLGTMKNRKDQKIIRPDMIHLLMEAQKGKLKYDDKMVQDTNAGFATVEESSVGKKVIDRVWTDTDLVAQAVLFFIAGFETVSSAMSFALHELALNPEIQDKLVQEIKENEIRNGGKFDYKSIQNMPYMDMVVSEVLRLWPPLVRLDRICTKDYNLGKPNSKATEDYILRKGEAILIPTFSFHRDPELFPNPLKFDPERFSEENKDKIQPLSYMPFGLGPRNCIGSRFALCEVKVMLYQLLQHMEVSPCEKTCVSSQLATDTFNLRIKGGHWVRLKIRS